MAAMTTHPHRPDFRPRRPRAGGAAAAGCGLMVLVGTLALASAGCKSNSRLQEEGFGDRNPIGVPPEAKVVQHREAKDGGLFSPDSWFGADDLTFKPDHGGRVWVVDEQNGKVVYRTAIRPGDELRVAPKENVIQLNKAYVYGRRLPDEHGFVIYFAPGDDAPAPTTGVSGVSSPAPK